MINRLIKRVKYKGKYISTAEYMKTKEYEIAASIFCRHEIILRKPYVYDKRYNDIDEKYDAARDNFLDSLSILENIKYSIVPHEEYDSSIKPYSQLECNVIRLYGVVTGLHYHAQRTQYERSRRNDDISTMNGFIDGMTTWDLEIRNLLKLYRNSKSFKSLHGICQAQILDILKEKEFKGIKIMGSYMSLNGLAATAEALGGKLVSDKKKISTKKKNNKPL